MVRGPVGVGGRLSVDVGERVSVEAALEGVEIGDGVAEGDGEAECV